MNIGINKPHLPNLGYGIMRCGNKSMIEIQQNIDMMMDAGYNYFEACEFYLNRSCETVINQALCSRYPREKFLLCDKFCAIGQPPNLDLEVFFQNQLDKCGVKYFDYYLIQAVDRRYKDIFEHQDIIQFFSKKKEAGLIHNLGFSYHDTAENLTYFLDLYDWDCVQIQLNVYDWYIGAAKPLYNKLKERNIPIFAMGPLKGGTLIHSIHPQVLTNVSKLGVNLAELQLRFLTCLSGVALILTGATDLSTLQENINSVSKSTRKITKTEVEILKAVVKSYQDFSRIACTECGYCQTACPKKINLPRLFSLYNQIMGGNRTLLQEYYDIQKSEYSSLDCVGCGRCADICPQHLNTLQYIQQNLFQLRL